MKNFIKTIMILVLVFTLHITFCVSNSYAKVPHLINYQGRLTDTNGKPLDGLYNITFRIYDAETAGNLLWQGTYNSVSISKGIFNILLGDINDSGFNFENLVFDKPYWLEIKIGDEVIKPRQQMTSLGYAIRAEKAEDVVSLPRGIIAMWSGSIANIPDGWILCNGENNTPDLRDKFIIAAREDSNGSVKTNIEGSLKQTGGSTNHKHRAGTLITDQSPNRCVLVLSKFIDEYTVADVHSHTIHGETEETVTVPPYYALAFIMKK